MVFLLFSVLFPEGRLRAAIAPEEIAVIVNERSEDSLRVGELYARLRNVPSRNLIRISVPVKERISRADYEERIAGPVRKALSKLFNKDAAIRCIVTTYGVPLRIDPSKPLIFPEDKISRYEKMIHDKEEELSRLKSRKREQIYKDAPAGPGLNSMIKDLSGEITMLRLKLGELEGKDTLAAVDSELALLFISGYPLTGWLPNPGYIYNRERFSDHIGRFFMVSRLDGPTPELAGNLVRTAIEVEQTGLSGNVYLDARGKTGRDLYGRFDEDIRRTAKILRKGALRVVLDNEPRLFRGGEAPAAALYCGWYSLGKYIDAFRWSKGAVGYHVASTEAASLHDPKRTYWVKSMIEKGVIASIGPVAEPYLSAFPPPSLFFPLFMSGKYTLAEVFMMTNPYLSWRMILVGDPLYNPFRNDPAFVMKDPPPPPD